MALLKEFLSGNTIIDLAASAAKEGSVFRMHLGKEEKVRGKNPNDDGRNKYFIVIGHDSEGNALGLVLIESEINQYLPQSRKDLHYPLKACKYEFLGGQDRFVDCSDFKTITKQRFADMFGGYTAKGCLQDEDLDLIKAAIASYENASPKLLKRFGLL